LAPGYGANTPDTGTGAGCSLRIRSSCYSPAAKAPATGRRQCTLPT